MATRHRLDHDLDPNQHRYLGGRGVDATYTAGGDLTLGQGNYFKVTPASTATVRRISGTDWTAGSTVVIEPTVATTFAPGSSSGGGLYAITTPTGGALVVGAGVPVAVSFDGSLWKMHTAGVAVPAADDHLVKARNADATTVGGLEEKTASSDTITRERFTDPTDGIEKVRFNATPQPATGGSWLYTGSIQATTLLDPVKSFVATVSGSGIAWASQDLWDVLENGDYQHKAVGQLYGLDPIGNEAFTLAQGDRVYAWSWRVTDGPINGGICTVVTLGNGSTKAVIRKTADVIQTGSTFKVIGVGAQYEDWYWEIDPDPTNLYPLTYKPDYVNTTTYNLLTGTEVSKAGSATRYTEVTIPGGSSGGINFAIPVYEMLSAIGVSSIPKGVVNWELLAYVVSDDPTATIIIRSFLSLDQGVLSRFGYADTPPIHATSATLYRCQGTIPADIACSPADKLSAVFYGYSNSASAVTIRLVYNSATHATRVQTPVVTGSYGTLDHQLLTMESRGFPAGYEAAAARARHPRRASEDIALVPLSLASENLTPNPIADTTIISTEQTISRIDSSQYPGGFCRSHKVFFINGGHFRQGQGDSGDFLAVDLGNFGGLPSPDCEYLDLDNNGVADFMLIGGGWRLQGFYAGRKNS